MGDMRDQLMEDYKEVGIFKAIILNLKKTINNEKEKIKNKKEE